MSICSYHEEERSTHHVMRQELQRRMGTMPELCGPLGNLMPNWNAKSGSLLWASGKPGFGTRQVVVGTTKACPSCSAPRDEATVETS